MIKMKRLMLAPLICVIVIIITRTVYSEGTNQLNTTKLQARISLETKNLDIDEKFVDTSHENLSAPLSTNFMSENSIRNFTSRNGKIRIKNDRSSRRLSNIWSMFLPGSDSSGNNDSDYDESTENDESLAPGESSLDEANLGINEADKTKSSVVGDEGLTSTRSSNHKESSDLKLDQHDDKLVAKYSKLTKPNGSSISEFLLPIPSGLTRSINQLNQTDTTQAPSTTSSNSSYSEHLITGSLTNDMGVTSQNMNDIVSSIINSMNQNSNNITTTSTPKSSIEADSIEREDDDKSASSRNTTDSSDQFERWLNRIQFKDNPSGFDSGLSISNSKKLLQSRSTIAPLSKIQNREDLPANQAKLEILQRNQQSNATFSKYRRPTQSSKSQEISTTTIQPEVMRLVEAFAADMRARQQLQQLRQSPKQPQLFDSTKSSSMILPPQINRLSRNKSWSTKTGPYPNSKTIADHNEPAHIINKPPRKMQLRQNPTQLIQGAKHPMALASTISINTLDGNNNTLSSIAPHHSPLIADINTFENNTISSSGNSSLTVSSSNVELGPVSEQQNELQSQDEILRQVTSAINFEQQLNHKKLDIEKPNDNSTLQKGEPISQSLINESEPSDAFSKMFKVGSSISELLVGSSDAPSNNQTTTTKPSNNLVATNSNAMELLKTSMRLRNGSSSVVGLEDLDKNFDKIADKLRILSMQNTSTSQHPTENSNSNQPSWLRKPNLNSFDAIGGNFSKLAALIGGSNGGKASSSLEQLRELYNKHERNKNELKNSEESMNQLLKQLLHAENEKIQVNKLHKNSQKQPVSTVAPRNLGQQVVDGVTNMGWTPVSSPISPLMSPANLIKNQRFKQPFKISQSYDNIGYGKDLLNGDDEYIINDLSSMFENTKANLHLDDVQNGERILGLPIAIIREDEDRDGDEPAPARLEEAVEHLLGHHNRQLLRHNKFASRLANPQASPIEQQNQLQLQKPATFLPKPQFIATRSPLLNDQRSSSQHHLPPGLNNLGSLLHEQQQIGQYPEQQPYNGLLQQLNTLNSADLLGIPIPQTQPIQDQSRTLLLPKIKVDAQKVQELKLQLEELQRAQQINTESHSPPERQVELKLQRQTQPSGGAPFPREALPHEVGLRAPLVAASLSNGGPPVRFREISVYRPFGYESHHAIAYQASPTVAALFPGLAQSSRPSILRHMTPFRAIQTQRGLINPIMSPTQMSETVRNLHSSPERYQRVYAAPSYNSPEARLPIDELPHQQHYMKINGLLKRHSHPHSDEWVHKDRVESDLSMFKSQHHELNLPSPRNSDNLIEQELPVQQLMLEHHFPANKHHPLRRRERINAPTNQKSIAKLENTKRSRMEDNIATTTKPLCDNSTTLESLIPKVGSKAIFSSSINNSTSNSTENVLTTSKESTLEIARDNSTSNGIVITTTIAPVTTITANS